jgi:hypothetical protein
MVDGELAAIRQSVHYDEPNSHPMSVVDGAKTLNFRDAG